MGNNDIERRYPGILLFLLSLCIVLFLRIILSLFILPINQIGVMNALDQAIKERSQELTKCQKGELSKKKIQDIKDEDDSENIFSKMRAYKNNITEVIKTDNGHYDVVLAPNILQMVAKLKPKAVLLKQEDISKSILDDYPYIDFQMPHMLLDDSDWVDKYDVFALIQQDNSLKLVYFQNKELYYEMHVLDSFPVNNLLDNQGRYQVALYHVPPPSEENMNRPFDERSNGCDMPHYVEMDCDVGPLQIKLRFINGTAFYYYGHRNKPYSRSKTKHKDD